jgi:hypothetical protein
MVEEKKVLLAWKPAARLPKIEPNATMAARLVEAQ